MDMFDLGELGMWVSLRVCFLQVKYYRETGESRGFGFINMSTAEEADMAIEMFHHFVSCLCIFSRLATGFPQSMILPFKFCLFSMRVSVDVSDKWSLITIIFGEGFGL